MQVALMDLFEMIRTWRLGAFTIYIYFGNDWLGFDIVKVAT